MTGEERRRAISGLIGSSPRTASGLAELFGVSRQVIVQDVALLRAEGAKIISTNRGYVAENPSRASRVFKVRHTDAQVREELYLIVDAGGRVEDVYVWHKVYGKISAPMGIDSRRKAEEFVKKNRKRRLRASQKHHGRLPLPYRFGGKRGRARRDRRRASRARIFRRGRKLISGRKLKKPRKFV